MKNGAALMIILTIVGLGAGFGGGYYFRNYQLSQNRSSFTNGGFQRYAVGAGGRGAGAGMRGGIINGTILSMDSGSITVKLVDGSSKIILLSGSTTYSNTSSATQSDLKTGVEIAVIGTVNSDGSVTAANVQMNPMMFRPQGSPIPPNGAPMMGQ